MRGVLVLDSGGVSRLAVDSGRRKRDVGRKCPRSTCKPSSCVWWDWQQGTSAQAPAKEAEDSDYSDQRPSRRPRRTKRWRPSFSSTFTCSGVTLASWYVWYAPSDRCRLPVVITCEEVEALLLVLDGTPWIMAMLLYGSGLRLMECLRRIKDIDFSRHEVLVREGKGDKDRVTMLPAAVVPKPRVHLDNVHRLHAADVAAGFGSVSCPAPWRASAQMPTAASVAVAVVGRVPRTGCSARLQGDSQLDALRIGMVRGRKVAIQLAGNATQSHAPPGASSARIRSAGRLGWCFHSDAEM